MITQKSGNIRAAVVGGGAFGEMHLRTFLSMPRVDVAGVYTLESARGQELCQRYGGRNYTSLEELAADPAIDLVSIVTPESQHVEACRILAVPNKALYIEKPLATSLSEARTIRDLVASVPAMSGHCLRFEPRLVQVFERLRGVPRHHLSFRNRRSREEKDTYGRVHPAYAMLCHEVELSNAFADSPFKRVIAMETRFSGGQVDGMTILIEYENGVTSSVEGGWYLPRQKGCIENDFVSILSAAGIDEIALPHLGSYRLSDAGLEISNLHYGHSIYGVEYGPLRSALDYLVHCILTQTPPAISTITDGFHAVELIETALQSVRENRWIERLPS